MNENLAELLNDELEVTEEDTDLFEGKDELLSDLKQGLFEARLGNDLSTSGLRGVTHALEDIGMVTLEDGDARERLWIRSAAHEAEKLGLSKTVFARVRSQVA